MLFLKDAPEFGSDILAALAQPLGIGEIVLARAGITVVYPARFILVAGMAPCPCGSQDDCTCTTLQARRYRARPLHARPFTA